MKSTVLKNSLAFIVIVLSGLSGLRDLDGWANGFKDLGASTRVVSASTRVLGA